MKKLILFLLFTMVSVFGNAGEFINTTVSDKDVMCLAKNVYFEARDQSIKGQFAVALVTRNRVNSKRYPDTLCGVVEHRYHPQRIDCQFSWFCDGEPDTPQEKESWELAVAVAKQVAFHGDYIIDHTKGSTHYHAKYVLPWWASKLARIDVIGDHIFYVER